MAIRKIRKAPAPPPLTDDEKRIDFVASHICGFAYNGCQCVADGRRPRCESVVHSAKSLDAYYASVVRAALVPTVPKKRKRK